MRTMRLLAAFLVLAGASPRAWADSAAGASSFDFLTIDANARAVGLGGAYTALATDSNALLYNPAGLARVDNYEATFMHNEYVQGLSQEYVGFASKQGWGLSMNYLDFGSINRTTLSQPGGTGSTFGLNDFALSGGYGRALTPSLSLGGGAKLIRETIDTTQANGVAFDAGALYSVEQMKGLTFGASILNMGPNVKFASHSERLPMLWRLGTAYAFPAFKMDNTFALDVTRETADKVRMGFGLESVYDKMIAFRLGFTTRNDAGVGITAGVGWIWKTLSIDYAIAPLGTLGISNRVSATIRWGGAPPKAAAPAVESGSTPATPENHFISAQKLIEAGDLKAATTELDAAAALLAPDDRLRVLYHERMGTIARFNGDIPRAKYSYAEAMNLASKLGMSDPVVADAYTGFGLCLVAEGDTAQAVKFFRKALEVGASARTKRLLKDQLTRLQSANP